MKKETIRNIPESLILITTKETTYVHNDVLSSLVDIENTLFDGNCKFVVVRRPLGPYFDIDFMLMKLYNSAVSCMENKFFVNLGKPAETILNFDGLYWSLRVGWGPGQLLVIGMKQEAEAFELEFSIPFDAESEAVEEFTVVMNRYAIEMSEYFDSWLRLMTMNHMFAQASLERHE